MHVSPNQIAGLIEALAAAPYDGKADLPDIAYEQELEVDELFPVAEAMQLLRLADIEGGDIRLTHMGKRFADADLNERKEIFSRSLMSNVPLAAHIRRVLDERASHSAPKTRFLDELEDHMAEDAAEDTLKTVVSWARFGELFSYDDERATFSLENPNSAIRLATRLGPRMRATQVVRGSVVENLSADLNPSSSWKSAAPCRVAPHLTGGP